MHRKSQAGFSMIEMLVALAITMVIMGVIFGQIIQGQQYSVAQEAKLDLFQESRQFMDQMSRDLRSAGYPNTRNFEADPVSPAQDSPQEAVGLVKLDTGELWFSCGFSGKSDVASVRASAS